MKTPILGGEALSFQKLGKEPSTGIYARAETRMPGLILHLSDGRKPDKLGLMKFAQQFDASGVENWANVLERYSLVLKDKDNLQSVRRKMWRLVVVSAVLAHLGLAQSGVQTVVSAEMLKGLRWPDLRDVRPALQEFYKPDYVPAWLAGGGARRHRLWQ
jgi:hypothetical protein